MRDQITVLEALQHLDLEMRELESGLEKYPREISRFDTELRSIGEFVARTKRDLENTTKKKSHLEIKLAESQDSIKKAEKKLFEIKTYKEYEALQKEIGDTKRSGREIEEAILKEMEEAERLEKLVGEKELELAEKAKSYEQVISECKTKIDALDSSYTYKKKEREKVCSLVNSEILSTYNRVRQKNGVALVQAKNEMCTGCHMNIPPQLFNEVLTNSNIIQCPNCQRILYCEEKTNGKHQTA